LWQGKEGDIESRLRVVAEVAGGETFDAVPERKEIRQAVEVNSAKRSEKMSAGETHQPRNSSRRGEGEGSGEVRWAEKCS
jgi:hypothetical protein